jgi:hypothetical protein
MVGSLTTLQTLFAMARTQTQSAIASKNGQPKGMCPVYLPAIASTEQPTSAFVQGLFEDASGEE